MIKGLPLAEIDQVKDRNIEDELPERPVILLEVLDPYEMLEEWYKVGEELEVRGKLNPDRSLKCEETPSIDTRKYQYVTAVIRKFQTTVGESIRLQSILIHELSNDHRPLFIGENVSERNLFASTLKVAGIKPQQWVNRLIDGLCEFISKENEKKRTLL
jgi:hypothetical protein